MKYVFLGPEKEKPMIISAALNELEEHNLRERSTEDLKGINPSTSMHKILLEENAKTSIEHQRRLDPVMKKFVRKEVVKWLTATRGGKIGPTR